MEGHCVCVCGSLYDFTGSHYGITRYKSNIIKACVNVVLRVGVCRLCGERITMIFYGCYGTDRMPEREERERGRREGDMETGMNIV